MPTEIESLEQFQEIITQDNLTIVDFWATWCGPCVRIAPWFAAQAEQNPEVNFCKVDVDEQGDITEECEIEAMPTFILFKKGEEVGRIVGGNQPEVLRLISELK